MAIDEIPGREVSGHLIEAIAGELEQSGLNLFALLERRCVDDRAIPAHFKSIALVGNYGRRLWDQLPDIAQHEHPIDDYSRTEVERVLTEKLGTTGWTILFPGRSRGAVPGLQTLGEAAGWHYPSPLGNGIHPLHGLWFAYRAVVAFDFAFPESRLSEVMSGANAASPCLSCVDQPCIGTCPASALVIDRLPNLHACAGFRSSEQSPCAERCLARESCPVGTQSRYADEQIRYFYRQSLDSLQRWVADSSSEN